LRTKKKFLGTKKNILGPKKKIGDQKKNWDPKKSLRSKNFFWGAIFFFLALKKLWGRNKYKSKDD
jgi:hypothetical protein